MFFNKYILQIFQGDDIEDTEWKRDNYCQPRNILLSLTADFVAKCSAKLQEINKKNTQDKSFDLLDNKCYMKLVDVAHSLLKMAPYDLECIRLEGLQKYMHHVFPLTDWSLESMRPSLTIIIRRLDKLFAKIHKNLVVYHAVDWNSAASLLKGNDCERLLQILTFHIYRLHFLFLLTN